MNVMTQTNVDGIISAIRQAIPHARLPAQLHEPRFAGREKEYLQRCIDSGWVSSGGPFVEEFENKLAALSGTKFAVATMSGTAALHAALHIIGVAPGDEVIMPALTFVATANAVTYCGAVPHFVDMELATLGLDPQKLKTHLEHVSTRKEGKLVNRDTGRPMKAVVPVHVFGHPVDMDALNDVCRLFDLPVVEDATESLGSLYKGKPCGGLGLLGVLSFNGNKIVTTGGGGAIVTDDELLARRAKHLTTTAKQPHPWAFVHDEIGWNYRLPNLNAALGLAQLEELNGFVESKRALAGRYAAAFAGVDGVSFVREPAGTRSNYWLNAILLEDDSSASRDAVLQASHKAGFLTRPAWTPMHQLAIFAHCPRSELSVTESLARRLVNLPSSAGME